ncbi:MAG: hypothetical protein M3Z24_14840, partial [Chloroflexota bacterium]|nr:hypothetical protein [Chloroflexota bacterium]
MVDIWTAVIGIIIMLVVVGGLVYMFYSRTNAVQKTGYGAIIMLALISMMIPIFWIAESGNQASAKADQFKTSVERGQALYAQYCVAACYTISTGGKLTNPNYNGYSIQALNQLSDDQITNIIAGGVYNSAATPQPTNPNQVPRSDMYGGPLDSNDVQYLLLFIRSADSSYLQKNGYPSVNGFDNFVQYLQTNYPS